MSEGLDSDASPGMLSSSFVRGAIGAAILIGALGYLGLHLWEPELSLTWAYAHLNRLPFAWPLSLVAVFGLPVLAVLAARLPIATRVIPPLKWRGALLAFLIVSALFLLIGWFFPAKAISLDATAFAIQVWKGGIWTTRWYMTLVSFTSIFRVVEWLAPVPVPARDVVSVLNVFLVGASYVLFFACARRLTRNLAETFMVAVLAWTAFGNLQLSLYYMDIYPTAQFITALFLWTTFRFLEGRGDPAWPILVAMLSPFFYVGMVLLAPAAAVVVLLAAARPRGIRYVLGCLAAGMLLAGLLTWPGFGYPFAFGPYLEGLLANDGRQFGLANDSSFLPLAYLFSLEHLVEYLHTLLLIDGIGLWLCATAGIPVLFHALGGRFATPAGILFLVAAPILAYAYAMDPLWGAYADWDLFSYVAVPTSLLGGYAFVVWGRAVPRWRAPLFGLLLAASLVHLAARLNALEVESERHFLESPRHLELSPPALASPETVVSLGDLELPESPNVFLLNIDMLRADHLGVHGYPRATTPVLDRIAREGIWFRAARAHAPWTYPSVVSLLSGLYPTSHGATYSGFEDTYVTTTVPEELETIATVLDGAGYSTAAFITNPLLKRSSGLDRGFDVFQDEFIGEWKRLSAGRWWGDSMTADRVHEAVFSWLDTNPPAPLFAYIHYIDVHGPYLEPRPFGGEPGSVEPELAEQARLTGKPRQLAIDLYDGELARLDSLIGDFLSALDERGVLANSIVMITADHGEEFGEHAGHGHGHTLYEEMLHVPFLVLRTDAVPHTRVIDMPVAQIDILPTIAELVGAPIPAAAAGRSLAATIVAGVEPSPRAILSEMDNRGRPVWNAKKGDPEVSYALLLPPTTKYVLGLEGPLGAELPAVLSGQETFFDLAIDPDERTGIQPSLQGTRVAQRELQEVIDRARSVAMEPGTATIDEATRQRLRVLGYLPDESNEGD